MIMTLGSSIVSLIIVMSTGSRLPTCSTVSVTGVPFSPRILFTASRTLHPRASTPSTARILSPARMPARSAGVFGNGLVMMTPLRSGEASTWAPIPPKFP